MLLTETLTGTLRKPAASELYTESEPTYAVALADSGSTVMAMVCGVAMCRRYQDVCNHETVAHRVYGNGRTRTREGELRVAPRVRLRRDVKRLGLIFSVCACSAR